MNFNRFRLILIALFFSFSSFSQSIDSFERLVSQGEIPDFFVEYLDDKIANDKEKLEGDESISSKNAQDFTAISNYKLQQLIQSGRVLYGDPLTEYANRILKNLIEHSDEDLDHVQLYTLKSNEVNAFATHQGIIFITVGLWGQLENEAQLAFILAHELTHVIEKHSQLSYQHTSDLGRSGRYGGELISSYYQYSKGNEEESDKQGFKLAIKAGYNAKKLFETFNVLLYSYLPIDEMKVDLSSLENDEFKITEDYILKEMKGISAEDDVDDEFHTHPNISNRRTNIKTLYNARKNDEDTKVFIAGTESSFNDVRRIARFEMMNIFLRRTDYIKGMYHNMILSQEYPENMFLTKTRAMVWYGMTAFENSDDGTSYSSSYRKKEGEIQQLYYFLHKLKNHELAAIATKEVWEASLANPEDDFLKALREKVMLELIKHEENNLVNFASELAKDTELVDSTKESNPAKLSKYDKIAKKNKKVDVEGFTYYAFLGLITNSDFIEANDQAKKDAADKEDREDEINEQNRKPKESTLDIKSLIMTTPNYYKKDNRTSIKNSVKKNDMNESQLVGLVQDNADKLGIKLHFIDDFKANNFNTEQYNNFSLLYDYLGERSQYSGLGFYPYSAQYIGQLQDDYGSNYVGLVGIYTEVTKKEFNASAAVLSVLVIYALPFYLKWQLTADKYTDYGFVVYNLETHNPAYISNKSFNANMNTYLQNAHIYNSLNQIVKKK